MSFDTDILRAVQNAGRRGVTAAELAASVRKASHDRVLFGLRAMAAVGLVEQVGAHRRWVAADVEALSVGAALLRGAAAVRRARRHDPTIDVAGEPIDVAGPFVPPGFDE